LWRVGAVGWPLDWWRGVYTLQPAVVRPVVACWRSGLAARLVTRCVHFTARGCTTSCGVLAQWLGR